LGARDGLKSRRGLSKPKRALRAKGGFHGEKASAAQVFGGAAMAGPGLGPKTLQSWAAALLMEKLGIQKENRVRASALGGRRLEGSRRPEGGLAAEAGGCAPRGRFEGFFRGAAAGTRGFWPQAAMP
jgi:hypothetical protein